MREHGLLSPYRHRPAEPNAHEGRASTPDLVIFRKALFTTDNENADHDGNGVVSTPDLFLFRQQLFNPDAPGPSGFVIPTR
jgi:hypothetical protein